MKFERFFSIFVTKQPHSAENNMSSSYSWNPDKHRNRPQSLWLRTTLSELDRKMNVMMTLLEEDNSSSVKTHEIYNNGKPELKELLEDFNRSYRSLAEQCDRLRSKSHCFCYSGSSSSFSYAGKTGQCSNHRKRVVGSFDDSKSEAFDSLLEDPDVECKRANFHFQYLNRLADELMSTEPCKMTLETETKIRDNENSQEIAEFLKKEEMQINDSELGQATTGELETGSSGWMHTWHELKFQVTKLLVQSLRQQGELLRRNEEKRRTINNLRAQLEQLRSLNRTPQSGARYSIVEVKRGLSRMSRLSGQIFSKFFKIGCL